MVQHEGSPDSQQQFDPEFLTAIAERVDREVALLDATAEAIGGEGARVEDVFPMPTKVRKDAPMPEWAEDETKVAKARETAHEFGYGAEQDTPSGLQGGRRVLRGGLYWKVAAEVAALDVESGVTDVTYSGSPNRKLNDAEQDAVYADIIAISESLRTMPDTVDDVERSRVEAQRDRLEQLLYPDVTEYDMVFTLALNSTESRADDVRELPFGYEVLPGNKISIVERQTMQFLQIGTTRGGQNVRVLRVDQQLHPGDKPGEEVRSQPDSASLMEFTSYVADSENAPTDAIVIVDSNTYAASVIEAVRASLRDGQHQYGVVMYGRSTLARVKHADMQPDMPLNQVPGEFRARYVSLQSLRAELQQLSAGHETGTGQ